MIAGELDHSDAQREVLALVRPLPAVPLTLDEAHGRVLADTPTARWQLPGADQSVMDGWAVRSADLQASPTPLVRLQRRGESAAGHPHEHPLRPGEALRISTGALLPDGADMVVAQEDCRVHGDHLDIDRDQVGDSKPGHFVRRAGSDVLAGAPLLPAGSVLGPGELGLLAGCGHATAHVHRPPRVAILCTGDELVPVGAWPQRGQVVSSNGLMLAWMAREAGAHVTDLGIARDEPDALRSALTRGLEFDLLLTCGGISVGDHDLVLPTLIGLGAELVFRRLRLRPGRPCTLLRAPGPNAPVLVFALPGNPASAHVGFELLVRPALRRLQGHSDCLRPTRSVMLTAPAARDSRRVHMVRARVDGDQATPLPGQTSGDLRSIAGHNALLELSSGTGPLPAGARVTAHLL